MKNIVICIIGLCLSMMPIRGWSKDAYVVFQKDEIFYDYYPYSNFIVSFYYDDLKNTRSGDVFDLNGENEIAPWSDLFEYYDETYPNEECHSVGCNFVIDPSFADVRPVSTNHWFYINVGDIYSNEITITGLQYLNTSEVKDMSYMFFGVNQDTLDISHFDTKKVTNMSGMFYNCAVNHLILGNINTSNVTDMSCLFSSCLAVETLDFSNFNTSKVTDMSNMFSYCYNLKSLDLSNFDTSKVTNMNSMFYGCSNLTNLDLSCFNTANVTTMSSMFNSCKNISSFDLSKFNTSNVTSMSSMFNGCSSLTNLVLSNFNVSKVEDMSLMFKDCKNLTTIDLLFSTKTSNVKNLNSMFKECNNLKSIDFSSLNTSNVTTMNSMFYNCSSLTNLDLSNFNTANVKDMGYMFLGCSGLTNIDFSSFNTTNLTTMYSMFLDCSSLVNIDLSNFDTSNVTNMSSVFSGCSSLANLDLTKFNTEKVTTLYYMFKNCSGLSKLDLSSFNTENVTIMSGMFYGCNRLSSIDLGNFKTQKLKNVSYMFFGCGRLESLDLTNFNIILSSSYYSDKIMFGCGNLKSLSLPNTFSALSDNSCTGVGSSIKPCALAVPNDFDFGQDITSGSFEWKGGMFSLQGYTDLSNYDDVIYVQNAKLAKGSQGKLSVKMNNTIAVRGFQFDLVLPNGVSVAENEDGSLMVKLSSSRGNTSDFDVFTSARQVDGSIRVLCLSLNGATLSGNSGEICKVTVDVDEDMADGDYFVKLKNIVYTDVDANKYNIAGEVVTKLTVDEIMAGDANGDGSIDVADVAVAANYILGKDADGTIPSALDVNGDGSIDVSDLAAICNLILHGTASAPAKLMNDGFSSNVEMDVRSLTLCAGETAELELTLDNPMEEVCSWQTDLKLPEGFHVESVRLADVRKSDQKMYWEPQDDGVLRILCVSMNNKPLHGSEGTVALVKFKVDENMAPGIYDADMNATILASGIKRLTASDSHAAITINGPTGIVDVANQVDNAVERFGVNGARLGNSQSGISIIKMSDGTIRKVTNK